MLPFSRAIATNRPASELVEPVPAIEGVELDHVSVCLITYNEEQFLEPCLRRLQAHFGHFAILDMGSRDRTVAIVRDVLGSDATLEEWPRRNLFEQGFAAARNAATRLADRPWAFHVDADELLMFEARAGRILLEGGPSTCPAWKVVRRNLIGDAPASLDPDTLAAYAMSSLEQHVRLYRRQPGAQWAGFLHEEVFVGSERATFSAPVAADISLDHISQFKSGEVRGLKESFYAWMLMSAYFRPEIRAGMQPEYIRHTEAMWDVLYPLAIEFGAKEGLSCEWPVETS